MIRIVKRLNDEVRELFRQIVFDLSKQDRNLVDKINDIVLKTERRFREYESLQRCAEARRPTNSEIKEKLEYHDTKGPIDVDDWVFGQCNQCDSYEAFHSDYVKPHHREAWICDSCHNYRNGFRAGAFHVLKNPPTREIHPIRHRWAWAEYMNEVTTVSEQPFDKGR